MQELIDLVDDVRYLLAVLALLLLFVRVVDRHFRGQGGAFIILLGDRSSIADYDLVIILVSKISRRLNASLRRHKSADGLLQILMLHTR